LESIHSSTSQPAIQGLALKEWAVAVAALAHGETILLLRKGGIHEQRFVLPQAAQPAQFWLYPTYEHQKPELLKPDYACQVQPVESGWHPETVEIQAWAKVTDGLELESAADIAALLPHHIWNERFVTERLRWKPKLPLTALLLRVYRLDHPQMIPYREAYSGCKSWIDLAADLAVDLATDLAARATPALSDTAYTEQRMRLSHDLSPLATSEVSYQ
jgi:hypothetical protein